MNLNFIIDNTSITRYSYDKRIDINSPTDTYYNKYHYRNFVPVENFSLQNQIIGAHTDENGFTYDSNIKKNIKIIDDLYVPTNTLKSLYPIHDAINNNGGTMYMSSNSNSRIINFSNIIVPLQSDKFIIRFAPLFDFQQINLINNDVSSKRDYMILTISVYIHGILFIELGFNTNGNIYINNDANREITDVRNKIDTKDTPFEELKKKVLYNSFYIILDRDLADVRFYDPYYYIYDESTYRTIPRTSDEYNTYLFSKNDTGEEIQYIENNIDFLTVYKKCKYDNALSVNKNQLVDVVISSTYMDNIYSGYYINKYKNTKLESFKMEFFKYYTNKKFEKRRDLLKKVESKIKQKINDAINLKISRFYSDNNENSDYNLITYESRSTFHNICTNLIKDISENVYTTIDKCFFTIPDDAEVYLDEKETGKIGKIEILSKNNFLTEMIENNNKYLNKICNLIILKTDVTSLLRALPLKLEYNTNFDDDSSIEETILKEIHPLTEIHEEVLLKYRKMLIVNIYNTIYETLKAKISDITILAQGPILYNAFQKIIGVGTTNSGPIQLTGNYINESHVNAMDIKNHGNKGYTFQRSKNPSYDSVNYNNLYSQSLMEYIIQIITNELLNLYLYIIMDLSIAEKTTLEKEINNTLAKEYSILPETYKYNIYLDKFQMLYMVPYDKEKDKKERKVIDNDNIEHTEYYYDYENEYPYIIDTIFNMSIPDRIKFKDIIDNYNLYDSNITIEQSDKIIINSKD